MAGMIVLERCTVESEAFSGNRNAFRLGKCRCVPFRLISLLLKDSEWHCNTSSHSVNLSVYIPLGDKPQILIF